MKFGEIRARLRALDSDVRDYLAEIANLPRHRKARWWSLLAEFPVWRASLAVGRSPIDDAWPWFTFGAIRRTRHLLRPGFRVFEFGAGGSTLCFLGRESSVVTVDHDRQWIDRVAAVVRQKGYANWKPLVQPPVASAVAAYAAPEDPDGYVSSGTEYRGLSFEAYAASIDDYDDETFDLVVVDGRARPSCGKHARPKVKPGGYLILDNSERATYSWIHDDLANRAWEAEHFYGPGPYNRGFWQTSIYRRPFLARP